uniref:Uncharacterized protein n=1 Tax=Oryza brachyantha TaxID=4533 RepID=J3MK57_ORYBR
MSFLTKKSNRDDAEPDNALNRSMLRAGDIAEATVFLTNDESRHVSGHNLIVDDSVTTSRNAIGL